MTTDKGNESAAVDLEGGKERGQRAGYRGKEAKEGVLGLNDLFERGEGTAVHKDRQRRPEHANRAGGDVLCSRQR